MWHKFEDETIQFKLYRVSQGLEFLHTLYTVEDSVNFQDYS